MPVSVDSVSGGLTVGVVMTPKKEVIWRSILTASRNRTIRYTFDYEEIRSSASVVLAKVSDFDSPEGRAMVRYLEGLPERVVHVASVAVQRSLADRWIMYERAELLMPRTTLIRSTLDLQNLFGAPDAKYILKPRVACGPSWSHHLVEVISLEEAVHAIKSFVDPVEFVAQEFVPNGNWFYKVFVIGKNTFIYKRDSGNSMGESISAETVHDEQALNDIHQLISAANLLSEKFELTLFGADFVKHESTGELFLVDVNYFPTYAELGAARSHLLDEYLRGVKVGLE